MNVRSLGWAGFEIEADGATVVIDPLAEPAATFAALGDAASGAALPEVVAAREGMAVAALLTHLHRDHADAGALSAALANDAPVFEPAWPGGEDLENLALAQAAAELGRAGLDRREVAPWERAEAGPFAITAAPAVDGLGDPQVSWVVEADGARVLHLGDTRFHGFWWRIARRHGPFDVVLAPINGPAVDFPHLQPPSPLAAAMEPEEAALAGELLGAARVVPMHFDGYAIAPWYRPTGDAVARFRAAAEGRPYEVVPLAPGDALELPARAAA
jgi:L-ascorbate metabolism protein UlaG (beta-lactamase superfamily)